MNIDMKKCCSSQVHSTGYDPVTKTLAVKFNSGGVYHYHNVPQETADAMDKAESVGAFLGKSIKGKYEFTKQDSAA